MASYVKRWEGKGTSIGGLFGAEIYANSAEVLSWSRTQQAAFLVVVWQLVASAVATTNENWAQHLRRIPLQRQLSSHALQELDPAFISNYSLLATDQGVRGVLQVTNDMCYVGAERLHLTTWYWTSAAGGDLIENSAVDEAIESLENTPSLDWLKLIAEELMKVDWRTSSTPDLDQATSRAQMIYRGSGGYKELRQQLIHTLEQSEIELIRNIARDVRNRLRY